jgi:hypothetical protein
MEGTLRMPVSCRSVSPDPADDHVGQRRRPISQGGSHVVLYLAGTLPRVEAPSI